MPRTLLCLLPLRGDVWIRNHREPEMPMLRALKRANVPWIMDGEGHNVYLIVSRSGEGMPEAAKLRCNLNSTWESPDPFLI